MKLGGVLAAKTINLDRQHPSRNPRNISNLFNAQSREEPSFVHTDQTENSLTKPSLRPTVQPSNPDPCNDASQGGLDENLRETASATAISCLEKFTVKHFRSKTRLRKWCMGLRSYQPKPSSLRWQEHPCTPSISNYKLFEFFNSKFDDSSYSKKIMQTLSNLSHFWRTFIIECKRQQKKWYFA